MRMACPPYAAGELLVSEPAIFHSTIPHLYAVLPLRAHVHINSMPIHRATLGGNKGAFVMVFYIPTHPYIYVTDTVFFRTCQG